MILGFAHLAINSSDPDKVISQLQDQGYTLEASYLGIKNAVEKKPLLSSYSNLHDLHILKGDIVIEVLWHGNTCERLPLTKLDGTIPVVKSHRIDAERHFWTTGVGYAGEQNGIYSFKSRLPFWKGQLKIEESEVPRELPLLNMEGPICVAMYSTDVAKDAQRLEACGGTEGSNKFNVTVGERDLEVCFIRSPGGSILELIKVNKK